MKKTRENVEGHLVGFESIPEPDEDDFDYAAASADAVYGESNDDWETEKKPKKTVNRTTRMAFIRKRGRT